MTPFTDWIVTLTGVACSHSANPAMRYLSFGAGAELDVGVVAVGSRSRPPSPKDLLPVTESQCLPIAGGVFSGHLYRVPLRPRVPACWPSRKGCRLTLKMVPGG